MSFLTELQPCLVLAYKCGHGSSAVTRASSRTDGGDGGDDLAQLQLVQDGGFAGGVQTHHQDPHLLLTEEAFKEIRKDVPHPRKAAKDKQETQSTNKRGNPLQKGVNYSYSE